MSLERRFGLGLCSLGVGQAVLGFSMLVGSGADPIQTWATAFLAVASFALGAVHLSGRMALDVTSSQRRLLRFVSNASIVGGLGVGFVGTVLLVDHFLA